MRVLVLLTILASYSAGAKIGNRIIGGHNAISGAFPFSCAIYLTTAQGTYFCGGSLISNEWILTAGQCVYGVQSFIIHLGSNQLNSTDANRVIVSTSESVIHPDYDPDTLQNDIGLIKLRQPVAFSAYIDRLLLAYGEHNDNTVMTAIGWGQVKDTLAGLSNDLQYVDLVTIPISECVSVYGDVINENMFCVAGENNEGTCLGDSGSPLLEYQSVSRTIRHVGISSFISGNGCESYDPSGYTKTYPYREWISSVTSV